MAIDYADLDRGRGVSYWAADPVLRRELRRVLPEPTFEWARGRLAEFGETVGTTLADNADLLDRHDPTLSTYDRDGRVENEIDYHPAQFENERLTYEAGAVADTFRAPPGRERPLPLSHGFAFGYLLGTVDIGLGCPVAMTAGAAVVLERFGGDDLRPFYEGLTARDYEAVLQGAMFLTERQGGSDVGANETRAERVDGRTYRLTGEKWFCSNLDADCALVLARRPDAPDGTEGLSLFLLPRTKADGARNDYYFRRLKDKLGTRSVPTGELELRGAEAYLVGEPERGFRYMATMLNVERLHNAMASVGVLARAALESKVHAADREAFGSTLDEKPLLRRDLVELTVAHEAAAAVTFDAARAFDRHHRAELAAADGALAGAGEEPPAGNSQGLAGPGTPEPDDAYRLMRALVPVVKYRTARMAVDGASDAMEVLGGNGYVREWVTHRLLRDAQVLPIWEGPSNVMALDLLRALASEAAHEPLLARIDAYLREPDDADPLSGAVETAREERDGLERALGTLATSDREYAELQAKEVADYVFDVYAAAVLLAEAARDLAADSGDGRKALVARWWVDEHLREHQARGIPADRRLPHDHYDAIARYAAVRREELT
jgi:alkylation response protein AidB-like acyl-CoA dehydrogenase